MKTWLPLFAIAFVFAAVAFGFGHKFRVEQGVLSVIVLIVAFLVTGWIAFFGYYGFSVSSNSDRWFALAMGFLPLLGLMLGIFVGGHRQN